MLKNMLKKLFLITSMFVVSSVIQAETLPEQWEQKQSVVEQPVYTYDKNEETKTCTLSRVESETEVESITIPIEYEGYAITKVAANAFADIQGIKEVILLGNPEFLEEEGVSLFNNPTEIAFYYYEGSLAEKTFQSMGGKLVPISNVKGLNVKKKANLQSANLTWAAYTDSTYLNTEEYCIKLKKGSEYQKIGTVKGTSFIAKQLKAGVKNEFKVCAVVRTITGKTLDTLYSEPASVILKPQKVRRFKATAQRGKIRLSWTKVKDISGYQVQRKVHVNIKGYKPKFNHMKTVKGTKKLSITNIMLVPGMKYSYRIRTYKTVGNKKIYSDWLTINKKRCY